MKTIEQVSSASVASSLSSRFNYNKLQAVVCISASAAVSIALIWQGIALFL